MQYTTATACVFRPMQTANAKADAHRLIGKLLDDATWDELAHHMEVYDFVGREAVHGGAVRTLSDEEIKRELIIVGGRP